MKRLAILITMFIAACVPMSATVTPTVPPTGSPTTSPPEILEPPTLPSIRVPPTVASWQIQYSDPINFDLDVQVYNLDLIDTDPADIARVHERGVYVMCYFSAGSFENWRPDIDLFQAETLGRELEGWEGEKWLDIRRIDLLAPILLARLDLAVEKGCDGVDPDNVNGYLNETGFPLTSEDQLKYNIWLAQSAHERELAIGLKNDIEQIPDLLPYFDWELNEECFAYNECTLLLPFVEAGKPVFTIEYDLTTDEFCAQANEMGFNSIRKNQDLDETMESCRSS